MRDQRIELENGRYAVIRNFLRVRDRNRYQKALLSRQKITPESTQGGEIKFVLEGDQMIEAQELATEILLVEPTYIPGTRRTASIPSYKSIPV